jgi:hypothetical protein
MVISFCHFCLGYIAIGTSTGTGISLSEAGFLLSFLYSQKFGACFKQKPPKDKKSFSGYLLCK